MPALSHGLSAHDFLLTFIPILSGHLFSLLLVNSGTLYLNLYLHIHTTWTHLKEEYQNTCNLNLASFFYYSIFFREPFIKWALSYIVLYAFDGNGCMTDETISTCLWKFVWIRIKRLTPKKNFSIMFEIHKLLWIGDNLWRKFFFNIKIAFFFLFSKHISTESQTWIQKKMSLKIFFFIVLNY